PYTTLVRSGGLLQAGLQQRVTEARVPGERGLVAVEAQFLRVAATAQRAHLAVAVVVVLAVAGDVQPEVVVLAHDQREPGADPVAVVSHRVGAHARCAGVAIDLVVGDGGIVATEPAATQRQSETVRHQWAVEMEVGAVQVAERVVLLHGGFHADRATPAGADLAGDDV